MSLSALAKSRFAGLLLIAALLGLWQVSAASGWVVSDSWPTFTRVLVAGWHELTAADLGTALGATVYRMSAGFVAGSLLGVTFGVFLGRHRLLDWALRPLLEIQRTLPTPAIVPPLILLLGVDDALKIFVVSLAVFAPVFVNTYSGVRGLDETLLSTARTFCLGRTATLWKIVLPASAPAIAAGMRTALSLALVMAVIGEMISGDSGVGNYLMSMQYAMRADAMYASVFCLAAIGYVINRLFLWGEGRLLHWHHMSSK